MPEIQNLNVQNLKVLHLLIELGFRISDLGFRIYRTA